MHSIYLERSKEAKERRERLREVHSRAVRGPRHRALTESLAQAHHARIEAWMHTQLAEQEMKEQEEEQDIMDGKRKQKSKQPQQELTIAMITNRPDLFYRTNNSAPSNSSSSSSNSARRRNNQSSSSSSQNPHSHHSPSSSSSSTQHQQHQQPQQQQQHRLSSHQQISSNRYQTETERRLVYESSQEHSLLTSHEPYNDPFNLTYRQREKTRELGPSFAYKPMSERRRVQEAIIAADIGGRAFQWEEKNGQPKFREEKKEQWRAGNFTVHLPSIPLFSSPPRIEEPYIDVTEAAKANIVHPASSTARRHAPTVLVNGEATAAAASTSSSLKSPLPPPPPVWHSPSPRLSLFVNSAEEEKQQQQSPLSHPPRRHTLRVYCHHDIVIPMQRKS